MLDYYAGVKMLPLFSFEWVIYELGKWLGIRLTEKAVNRLVFSLKSAPKTTDQFFQFDRNIRNDASGEITISIRNILSTMNIASRCNELEICDDLAMIKNKLENLKREIENSKDLLLEKNLHLKGLLQIDHILLVGCFVVNEKARDLIDKMHEKNAIEVKEILEKINEQIRKLYSLLHVRSVTLSNPDPHFVRILEVDFNDVYQALRSLAVLAYSTEEEKGFFRRSTIHSKLCSRLLYVAITLEESLGPEIDFKIFFLEFKKMNPDIQVSPRDLEKVIKIIAKDGNLVGIENSEDSPKRVWTKLDFQKVFSLAKEVTINNTGLTQEELVYRTGWSEEYSTRVLDSLLNKGSARKAIDPDGTVRFFFPGLEEKAKQNESA